MVRAVMLSGTVRFLISGAILLAFGCRGFCQKDLPAWFHDAQGFCEELAGRTNVKGSPVPIGAPKSAQFADYATRPVAPPRTAPAIIGRGDWTDKRSFAHAVKSEISKGPDFAGRYAVVRWSCGTGCSNDLIADVVTGRTYGMPFLGVAACRKVTDLLQVEREPPPIDRLRYQRQKLETQVAFAETFILRHSQSR